jgi:hypothetical protein
VFRFRALAALAGRLPLGGSRELTTAVLVAARLARDAVVAPTLRDELRAARAQGARTWVSTLPVPADTRLAFAQVAQASAGPSREATAAALERLLAVADHALDARARGEVRQLIAAARATAPTPGEDHGRR